jgi:hypothetical protein
MLRLKSKPSSGVIVYRILNGLDLSRNMLWYTCLIKHTETLLRTKDCCTHSLLHAQQDALTHNIKKKDLQFASSSGAISLLGNAILTWITATFSGGRSANSSPRSAYLYRQFILPQWDADGELYVGMSCTRTTPAFPCVSTSSLAVRNNCTCRSDCPAQHCWHRSCRMVAALSLQVAVNVTRCVQFCRRQELLSAEIWRNWMTWSHSETVTVMLPDQACGMGKHDAWNRVHNSWLCVIWQRVLGSQACCPQLQGSNPGRLNVLLSALFSNTLSLWTARLR